MKLDGTDRAMLPSVEELETEHESVYTETMRQLAAAEYFAVTSGGRPVTPTPSHSVSSPSPRVTYTAKGAEDAPPSIFNELGSNRYIKLPDRVPQFVSRIQAARIYDQMVVNDATVDVSLRIAKTPILGAYFYMQPYDDEPQNIDIAQFVEDNFLNGSQQPFLPVLEEILRMFDYGFMCLEPVWEMREWAPRRANANRKKYTMLKKLGARHAPTISDIKYNDNGDVISIVQRAVRGDDTQQTITIPVDKIIPFTLNGTGGNIEGRALHPSTSIPTYEVGQLAPQTGTFEASYGSYSSSVQSPSSPLSEIQVGQFVYDMNGQPTRVVAVKKWEDRPMYNVTFTNGPTICADENHEWIGLDGSTHLVKYTTRDLYRGFAIPRVWRDGYHVVASIEKVENSDSICIEVDSPSHTFLATEDLIPSCNSLLRTAYKHWYYKDNLYKIDAIQKERHAIGVPRAKLAPGYTAEDTNIAFKLVSNLRTNENAGIVQPPQVEIDFAKMEGHIVDVIQSIEHHEARIMLNVYAEFMLLGLQGAGGRSTASAQVDIYTKAYRYIADLICGGFNSALVPKIVGYNFDTDCMPTMKARGLGNMQETQQWAAAIGNLMTAEAITPDLDFEQWVREQIDAPLKKGGKQTLPISREVGLPVAPPGDGGDPQSNGNGGGAKGTVPARNRTGNTPKGTNPT